MKEFFDTLNSLTPAGFMALLAYIIYLLVRQKQAVKQVSENHLSGLPPMQEDIHEILLLLRQQSPMLQSINSKLTYLIAKAKLDSNLE